MNVIKLNDTMPKPTNDGVKPTQPNNLFTVSLDAAGDAKLRIKNLENQITALKQCNNKLEHEISVIKRNQLALLNEMRSIKQQLQTLQASNIPTRVLFR